MSSKMVFVLLVISAVATADLPNTYGPPQHQSLYKEEGRPYDFSYEVKDDYAGTDFGHSAESDGNTVRGSYTVQLPDGRKQTVSYVADHFNGYQAEVSYEGEAQFPHEYGPAVTFKPQPSYQQPQPTYQQPQPTYQQPQPTYQQPQPTYQQPEPTYQQPQPTYQRPQPTYQRPQPTYQQPQPSYQ
ncbi:cell division protein ZipA-like [Penaeus chinensis]|uniref:cell division protein ZipA-like n=1 Tax=Penaeus chinensis TaxID=139456 RepID=UPI001FB845B6|nr:cell division protein ZipA-like [Penaeus chinensis]